MNQATLCYIRRAADILFLYRNKKKNDFLEGLHVGVGGKQEPGETLEECVLREIAGETGIPVTDLQIKGDVTFLNEGAEDWQVRVYTAETDYSGEPPETDEGELLWVDENTWHELDLSERDRILLSKILGRGTFTATVRYQMVGGVREFVGFEAQYFD